MIEVTVAYPACQGRIFNMDYHLKTHIPLFQKRMGAAIKTIRVSRGWCAPPSTSLRCLQPLLPCRRVQRGCAELYRYSAGRADRRSADGVIC